MSNATKAAKAIKPNPTTKSDPDKIATVKEFPMTVTLPSGKVAVVSDFKGRQVKQVHRLMGKDEDMFIFALIAVTVAIDGKGITIEEIDEMPGRDVLKLEELVSAFF